MQGAGRSIICGSCHKAGHRAFQCPDRSELGSSVGEASSSAQSVIRPCWACGKAHFAGDCPIWQERKQKGVCLLCGEGDHWIRACKFYAERVGQPAEKASSPTWCLRCSSSGHSTARCKLSTAAINMPPAEEKDAYKGICLWCALPGHDLTECMRRCPSIVQENSQKIVSMSDELAVFKKAVDGITTMQSDIATLKSDVQSIKEWKAQTERRVSKFDQFLDNEWPVASKVISDFQQAIIDRESAKAPLETTDVDSDELMLEQLTGSKRSPPDEPASSSKGKKVKTMWATLPPVSDGESTWDTRMSNLLISEWSPAKASRLRDWLLNRRMTEMVSTLDALPDERTVRGQIIVAILRGARVPPQVFKECE